MEAPNFEVRVVTVRAGDDRGGRLLEWAMEAFSIVLFFFATWEYAHDRPATWWLVMSVGSEVSALRIAFHRLLNRLGDGPEPEDPGDPDDEDELYPVLGDDDVEAVKKKDPRYVS